MKIPKLSAAQKAVVLGDNQKPASQPSATAPKTALREIEIGAYARGETFEPKGTKFYSQALHREMILVSEGEWKDWIVYKHPDGGWVSLRKASGRDIAELANAISKAHHS